MTGYSASNKGVIVISTHTPAWGVTVFWYSLYLIWAISTHTPAWGVTVMLSAFR